MPHFNSRGEDTWVCQKGAHICSGQSTWVDRDSEIAKRIGCHGNVCKSCLLKALDETTAPATDEPHEYDQGLQPPISLHEHCARESGLPRGSRELESYINRYYGHG